MISLCRWSQFDISPDTALVAIQRVARVISIISCLPLITNLGSKLLLIIQRLLLFHTSLCDVASAPMINRRSFLYSIVSGPRFPLMVEAQVFMYFDFDFYNLSRIFSLQAFYDLSVMMHKVL